MKAPSSIFAFYRASDERRRLWSQSAGAHPQRYLLYGLDELAAAGLSVRHNLAPPRASSGLHHLAFALNRLLEGIGGRGGDFENVLAYRREAARAALVFSSVDSVGFALVLLKASGLLRPPLLYAAIGLPERLALLRHPWLDRWYRAMFRKVRLFIAYGFEEAEWMRRWLGPGGPPVVFVPFGVDESYFQPELGRAPEVDILAIGADPHRDFELLTALAARRPTVSVRLITTAALAKRLGAVPPNVQLKRDVPFDSIRDELARARVVALPLRENTYTGATTTLLQAMAMAKPVVVSRTGAIREGYQLRDGENCALVPPGDGAAFDAAVLGLLGQPDRAAAMGRAARATVEQHLTWNRFVARMRALIEQALAP